MRDPAVDLVQTEARLMMFGRRNVTQKQFESLERRVVQLEASQAQNQASIDAEAQSLAAIGPKLDTIKSEIDALKAAQSSGQKLDFSKVDAAIASLSGQADADVADAAPPAPNPPVTG